MSDKEILIYEDSIKNLIHDVRGIKVIFDFDLAQLYGVETKQLKRQVRRNIDRFPPDFMFELTSEELKNLRRHFGTSSWGGTRYPPMAFTEQGVGMLASVLKSKKAVEVNIGIVRAFVQMRQISFKYEEVMATLEDIKEDLGTHGKRLDALEIILKQIMLPGNDNEKKH